MEQYLIDIFSILAMVGIAYLMAYWQGRDHGYQSGYSFYFDTNGAMTSDLVIYIAPSGKDDDNKNNF